MIRSACAQGSMAIVRAAGPRRVRLMRIVQQAIVPFKHPKVAERIRRFTVVRSMTRAKAMMIVTVVPKAAAIPVIATCASQFQCVADHYKSMACRASVSMKSEMTG